MTPLNAAAVDSSRSGSDRGQADGAGQRAQENSTIKYLRLAPQFLDALRGDLGIDLDDPPQEFLDPDVVAFVRRLGRADHDLAHKVMWAVRRTLRAMPRPLDQATRQAAISTYMLCACRWVRADCPVVDAGRVVKVPKLLLNPIAVLSATLFGGAVTLQSDASGAALAAHAYEVLAGAAVDPSLALLRAMYAKLHPERASVSNVTRRDTDDAAEIEELLSAIRTRINDIRRVEKSSLTLVVNAPAAFEGAAWAAELGLRAFAHDSALDAKVVKDLFVVSPDDLDNEIKELWRLLAAEEHANPTNPLVPSQVVALPTAPSVININAGNVALSTGNHSAATSNANAISPNQLPPLN